MKQKENRLPIFTKRFRELQGEKTNTEFADFLGLSRQTVGFYCNADRLPDVVTLVQIADRCKVSTDYLLGLTDIKTIQKDVAIVAKTVGLSEDAIEALKLDKGQSRQQDIFCIEDYLIKEFYVSYWARCIRDCVRNISQVSSLQSKLGEDLVSDQTAFSKWKATQTFEKALDQTIKDFSHLYGDDLKIADKREFLASRKAELESTLLRIRQMESEVDQEENQNDGK